MFPVVRKKRYAEGDILWKMGEKTKNWDEYAEHGLFMSCSCSVMKTKRVVFFSELFIKFVSKVNTSCKVR